MSDSPRLPPGHCVLAVCGHRDAGKTTLLEATVQRLAARGRHVAWMKQTDKPIHVDQPGKDSDRLFRAGATVSMTGHGETLLRQRAAGESRTMRSLNRLARAHDILLIEGGKHLPVPKVWLAKLGEPDPPPDVPGVIEVLPWSAGRETRLDELVERELARAWRDRLLFAGVLIGGASRRMGRPKQTVEHRGRSFLRLALDALAGPPLARVVLLGRGPLPADCAAETALPDAPALSGPLAGMVSAVRWAPDSAWLFTPCDLPLLRPEAVRWLLDQRRPGAWAVAPRVRDEGPEPLLALYEPPLFPRFEEIAANATNPAPRLLLSHPRVSSPGVPPHLRPCWQSVDTPEAVTDLPA